MLDWWWKRWTRANGGELNKTEDPELLLSQAQREMTEMHAKNRERAVQAITQKNNLQQMVDDTQKRVDNLRAGALVAEERGEQEQAAALRREAEQFEQTLIQTRPALEQAITTAESVKTAIRNEEERIRQKTAEALVLKAQWRASLIQQSLMEALQTLEPGEEPFARAKDRIGARHRHNRRLVKQALVQKNNLQQMASDTQKRIENLRDKAAFARGRGEDDLERGLLREMEQHEASLAATQTALMQAIEVTERAKTILRAEEDDLRRAGIDPHAPRAALPASQNENNAEPRELFTVLLAAIVFILVLLAAALWWLSR